MTSGLLNFEETVEYTGFSRGYLYKLTHQRIIPFYKPTGQKLFFDRTEIDAFLRQNRSAGKAEREQKAANYISK